MKLKIDSAGRVASRVCIGAHWVTFDQPATIRGGDDRGPSPLEVMMASVGACAHYYAAAVLFARDIATTGLTVEVDFQKSTEPPARVAAIVIKVTVPDSVPQRYLPVLQRAIQHCPAYGTLKNPPLVTLELAQS